MASKSSLSLPKLCDLFEKKGFIPTRYYSYQDTCIFIEIVSLSRGTVVMIYIPSRFEIPISSGKDVEELELIDEEQDPNEYAPTDNSETSYPNIDLKAVDGAEASNFLMQKYKKQIQIRSGAKKKKETLRDVIRQLQRLHNCVKDLPYYIAILDDGYLGFIRDGEADCYYSKNYETNTRRLRVVATLPTFYEKSFILAEEASQIYSGIDNILNDNMSSHATFLEDIISRKGNMMNFCTHITSKKSQYKQLISQYENMLQQLEIKHNELSKKLQSINLPSGGLEGELLYAQNKNTITQSIKDCVEVKKTLISQILKLRITLDNISLITDKVMFENSIMMDKMVTNFDALIHIAE